MGVPKFYRWVSERYPCLSQVVREHQIPEFDNMYLDMNGIIHPCSHPNDDDPHFRITEEQIFRNIFHYIEVLFQIIKPKKVFFMAVDGVAPRAKMNQQRGRRFRSAKEAEDNIRRAIEKGQVLPKEERFDSNCITPGTGFMTRLQEQLKYFVNEKITNDPAWQGLRVYLSGHQTPGEGEHKIMEFIRTERSKPEYDSNTRHCLYGLDADLIMLGLSSHDPHFSLLREEVKFGKTAKRIEKPENITFHLLHLSLFREYLDWEFHRLKSTLSFPYDLERIIDDWILMGFLVGNDFIPHLPNMHIKHNALPMLYQVYMEVLPTMDGYLHDGGVLNLERFEKYLTALSKLDKEKFDEIFVDMKWFEAKTKHGFDKKPGKSRKKGNKAREEAENPFAALEFLSGQLDQTKLDDEELSPDLAKLAAALDDDDDENTENSEEDVFEIEFAMYKKQYYREKFGVENISSDELSQFVWEYIRGIQWILHYYFNGVQSWGWYYPYHYAPFLSDLRDFSHYKLVFDMGIPFLPFEQLLAVLPAASKQLLPEPLQNLMIMVESPIIEYYPLDFKTDLNGKQQEWEAVVLIPFIDQKKLLDAMKPLYSRLTKEEKQRNTHGPFMVYTFESSLSFNYRSSFPSAFPDIPLCQAKCEQFDRNVLVTPREKLKKGLCEDVRLDVFFPGFPTLYHIDHTAELKKANVKVFQMHSRWESVILKLTPRTEKDAHKVAHDLLNEVCYVGWPHMVEAMISSVSDNTFRYTICKDKPTTEDGEKNIDQNVLTDEELATFNKKVWSYTHYEFQNRGIEVGEVDILIEACPIQGRRFVCGAKGQVTLEKEWSSFPKPYAFQAVAKDIFVNEAHSESKIKSIDQLFPVGSSCFMLASPHYGAQGEVLDVDMSQGRVRVQLRVPVEPNFASIMMQKESLSDTYIPGHVLSQKLGLSSSLLGKITAKFLIERGSREMSKGQGQSKLEIGLNMKSSKHNKELLGYVKRADHGGWLFSSAAQKIIMDYTRKFPRLFDMLGVLETQYDQIYESDLLTRDVDEAMLQEVQGWIKSLPISKQEPMSCESDVIDDQILVEIENALQQTKKSAATKAVKVRVRPYLLFKPSHYLGNTLPDSSAEFQLFDRVINVKLNSAVPFGLRGTIVGFHEGEDGDEMVEVMYDESFVGNQPIRRTSRSIYLVRPSSFIDLTYGERREAKKRGQPVPPPRPINKSFAAALSAGGESSRKDGSPHRIKANGESPRSGHRIHQGSPQNSFNNRKASKEAVGGPVVTVTRIATPPSKLATTQATSESERGNAGNSSEFASMWKELKMKENSPPSNGTKETELQDEANEVPKAMVENRIEVNDTEQKEKTQALCELLKIGRHSSPGTNEESAKSHGYRDIKPNEADRKEAGRSLSVDELFKTQASSVPKAPLPMQQPIISSGRLPSQILFGLCMSKGQPIPRLYYAHGPQGGIFATVELANGQKFNGTFCRDQMEAAESACAIALSFLNRMGQPMPFQRMPAQPFPFHAAMVRPQPMMRVQQPFDPRQIINVGRSHMAQNSVPTSTACSLSTNKSLDPKRAPFIPMQVTRRNLPSKVETSSNGSTEDQGKRGKDSTEVKPVEMTDRSQDKTALTSPPSTILMTPSNFTESKSKSSHQVGASQGGPPTSLSVDQITTGTKSINDHDNVPAINLTKEHEESKIEAPNDVTKDSKIATPKKTGRKSQRTMAANFSQKK